MEAIDEIAQIVAGVERAVEAFIQLSYFPLGSAAGNLDAGRSTRVPKCAARTRRVFLNSLGQRITTVLPGGTVEQTMTRTGRSGGFPCPAPDRDAMLWKSTIGRKLARLDPSESGALDRAARLRIVNFSLRNLTNTTDSILGSAVGRKQLSLHDVRLMQAETDDILRVIGTTPNRNWRGDPIQRAKREQGYRRGVMLRCVNRRRSIVNSEVYANALTMFAIVCGFDRNYCLREIPS